MQRAYHINFVIAVFSALIVIMGLTGIREVKFTSMLKVAFALCTSNLLAPLHRSKINDFTRILKI